MVKTESISITSKNGTFAGYLALPEASLAPGVIVIQEVFGVNEHIQDVTRRVAELGYVALAPDMFWSLQPNFSVGYVGADWDQAIAYMQQIDIDRAVEDVEASIQALGARAEVDWKRTGVVGFCWGGLMAYLVACRLNPTCAVSYYGGRIPQFIAEADKIDCPITFHFGETDSSIPPEHVAQIEQAHKSDDQKVHVYPQAGHGFHCDQRDSYHEPSAKLAWQHTSDFFKRHLG